MDLPRVEATFLAETLSVNFIALSCLRGALARAYVHICDAVEGALSNGAGLAAQLQLHRLTGDEILFRGRSIGCLCAYLFVATFHVLVIDSEQTALPALPLPVTVSSLRPGHTSL